VQANGSVVLREALDFERFISIEIPVIVSDGEFSGNGKLILSIQDVNDEVPRLVQNPSKFVIEENRGKGVFVGQVCVLI